MTPLAAALAVAQAIGLPRPATEAPHHEHPLPRPPPAQIVGLPWHPAVVKVIHREETVTKTQRQAAAKIALKAVQARKDGARTVILGSAPTAQTFDLVSTGWCARLVRQAFEVACQFRPGTWEFAATDVDGDKHSTAKDMALKLDGAGKLVAAGFDDLSTGDLLIHRAGSAGHVGIAVNVDGEWFVVENTSSGKRGEPRSPGTKLTPLDEFVGKKKSSMRVYRP